MTGDLLTWGKLGLGRREQGELGSGREGEGRGVHPTVMQGHHFLLSWRGVLLSSHKSWGILLSSQGSACALVFPWLCSVHGSGLVLGYVTVSSGYKFQGREGQESWS